MYKMKLKFFLFFIVEINQMINTLGSYIPMYRPYIEYIGISLSYLSRQTNNFV